MVTGRRSFERTGNVLTCRYDSGPRRARTDDLRIKSPQLYQLS
jgi:hypothetical protein